MAAEFTGEAVHKFVVAPETMSSTEEWIARKDGALLTACRFRARRGEATGWAFEGVVSKRL
jgi:hypothetical protein